MSKILFNASCLLGEIYINQRFPMLFKGHPGAIKRKRSTAQTQQMSKSGDIHEFLVFHPRLLLWSGDDCRSRSCYLVLMNPYSFLEPSSCLMVNFIFCCGFINCFFLSELNICDTDFRLARFYLLLERFFFYFLELRDFDTRKGTYSSEGAVVSSLLVGPLVAIVWQIQ
jgi:hypothetical protein